MCQLGIWPNYSIILQLSHIFHFSAIYFCPLYRLLLTFFKQLKANFPILVNKLSNIIILETVFAWRYTYNTLQYTYVRCPLSEKTEVRIPPKKMIWKLQIKTFKPSQLIVRKQNCALFQERYILYYISRVIITDMYVCVCNKIYKQLWKYVKQATMVTRDHVYTVYRLCILQLIDREFVSPNLYLWEHTITWHCTATGLTRPKKGKYIHR